MTSTPAHHDHDVFAREEPMHSVIQTTVQCVVILGFQNALHDFRISTNVCPQASVLVGIIEPSAVDRRSLLRVELFMRSPEFMTTMSQPGRLFKIRKSTAHDNRISLSTLLGISQLRTLTIACVKQSGKFDWSESRAGMSTPGSSSRSMTRSFKRRLHT